MWDSVIILNQNPILQHNKVKKKEKIGKSIFLLNAAGCAPLWYRSPPPILWDFILLHVSFSFLSGHQSHFVAKTQFCLIFVCFFVFLRNKDKIFEINLDFQWKNLDFIVVQNFPALYEGKWGINIMAKDQRSMTNCLSTYVQSWRYVEVKRLWRHPGPVNTVHHADLTGSDKTPQTWVQSRK